MVDNNLKQGKFAYNANGFASAIKYLKTQPEWHKIFFDYGTNGSMIINIANNIWESREQQKETKNDITN
jgi:hypothetical protein